MKNLLTIILCSLVLLSGCNDQKSKSPAEISNEEKQGRIKNRAKGLGELESYLGRLSKMGIELNYTPNAKEKISVDISGLLAQRLDRDSLLQMPEENLIERISKYLGYVAWLSDRNSNHYNEVLHVPGFIEKEDYYNALAAWPLLENYEVELNLQTLHQFTKKLVTETRNLYHACENKENPDLVVSLLRVENGMDSADCLTLFETLRYSTHLEITIPSEYNEAIGLVALRGMPLESLTITSEKGATVSLIGLEMAQDLRELALKNVKVEDFSPISGLKEMDVLTIQYPEIKRHLKNCPVKSENTALRGFCKELGF